MNNVKKIEIMKCRFLFLASMAMLIASCGGENASTDKVDASEMAEKVSKEGFSGERKSKAAVEYYLKELAGVDLNDMLPDYPYDCTPEEKWFSGEQRNVIAAFYKKNGEELSRDEYKAYVKKVYDVTKKVSDNGINIYGFEKRSNKDEANKELTIDELIAAGDKGIIYLGMYDWGFLKNGRMLHVYMQLDELGKDADKKYYARVQIAPGLEKSFDETMKDAEKALEDPEVQKAIKEYVKK